VGRPPKKQSALRSSELFAGYLRERAREPARASLDIDRLVEVLDRCHTMYSQGDRRSRTGVQAALWAVLAYIEGALPVVSGHLDRLMLPLRRLELALEDLDIGVVHPVVAPAVNRTGGTKLTRDHAEFRLLVCVAIDLEIAAGATPEDARASAARRLKKLGFRKQRQARQQPAEIDAKTIAGWGRRRFRYYDQVGVGRRLTFVQWMYVRTFIGFSKVDAEGPKVQFRERAASSPLAAVDHIFNVVLPVEFGHLRFRREK
jgi:hypothetical protein